MGMKPNHLTYFYGHSGPPEEKPSNFRLVFLLRQLAPPTVNGSSLPGSGLGTELDSLLIAPSVQVFLVP